MSIFSKLFGGGSKKPEREPESYKDFTILPEPIHEGSVFRVAAHIEKEIDGDLKSHHMIRADTLDSLDAAVTASVNKAKQMIDEQGDRIFR